jgi:hypothetical protein
VATLNLAAPLAPVAALLAGLHRRTDALMAVAAHGRCPLRSQALLHRGGNLLPLSPECRDRLNEHCILCGKPGATADERALGGAFLGFIGWAVILLDLAVRRGAAPKLPCPL